MLLLGAAALVITLSHDAGGQPPPTSTTSRAQHLAQLRAEAVAFAETFFNRDDAAAAAGDPRMIDDIYVPGTNLSKAVKKQIADRRAHGVVHVTKSHTEQVEVLSVDETKAEVRFLTIITDSVVKDIRTGKVTHRFGTGQRMWRLRLARIGGRWLVNALLADDSAEQGQGG